MSQGGNIATAARTPRRRSFRDVLLVVAVFLGVVHYSLGTVLWFQIVYAFGIDGENYGYYLRDGLPALIFAVAFWGGFVCVVRKPGRTSRIVCSTLLAAAALHLAIDERLHHFTVQMLTVDRGCVWWSPTWWWHEHQCRGWWSR